MSKNQWIKKYLYISIVSALLMAGPVHAMEKKTLTFGIVPQQSASKLARVWGPIMQYLGKKTGYKINFATAKTIIEFEKALAKGKYDIAYMNPYHYVVYHKHSGYRAIAKAKDKKIHGIIVVNKNSKIKSIKDLNNKVLAFPAPLAFAATLLTKSELSSNHIVVSSKYVSSHDSVYRNVADNNFVAGGGVIRTYKAAADEVRDNLRILYKTKGYTPHAFAVASSVKPAVEKKITSALVGIGKTPGSSQYLDALKIKGIARARNSDWNDVRKIRY